MLGKKKKKGTKLLKLFVGAKYPKHQEYCGVLYQKIKNKKENILV